MIASLAPRWPEPAEPVEPAELELAESSAESSALEAVGGEPRLVCYSCFRPAAVCYCDHTSRLDNRTHVTVVQHPREQFHPLGTARIVTRCLSNVELIVAHPGWERRSAAELFPPGAALLYPGPRSRELSSIPAGERPRALVVLDGTWHHARTLYRDHPVLRELPQVSFVPEHPTEYRVRREPKEEYVSTVEAVATALELLEPDLRARELLSPFRRMIDLHILATERAERQPRHKKQRSALARALPLALAEEFARAVLVYGEANPIGGEGSRRSRAKQRHEPAPLVYWTAKRLCDGAVFAGLVRPEPPLSDHHRQLLGLTQRDLERAGSLSDLKARWRAFLGPDDRLVAWNQSSFDLMQQLGGGVVGGGRAGGSGAGGSDAAGHLALKAVYRGLAGARQKKGTLEDVVAAEGLTWEPAAVVGRARERLGRAEAVARYLHARACGGAC